MASLARSFSVRPLAVALLCACAALLSGYAALEVEGIVPNLMKSQFGDVASIFSEHDAAHPLVVSGAAYRALVGGIATIASLAGLIRGARESKRWRAVYLLSTVGFGRLMTVLAFVEPIVAGLFCLPCLASAVLWIAIADLAGVDLEPLRSDARSLGDSAEMEGAELPQKNYRRSGGKGSPAEPHIRELIR